MKVIDTKKIKENLMRCLGVEQTIIEKIVTYLKKCKVTATREEIIEQIKQQTAMDNEKDLEDFLTKKRVRVYLCWDKKCMLRVDRQIKISFTSKMDYRIKYTDLGKWFVTKENVETNPTAFNIFYSEPRRVEAIELKEWNIAGRDLLLFETGKLSLDTERFREATEAEVEEKQLKSLFRAQ